MNDRQEISHADPSNPLERSLLWSWQTQLITCFSKHI